MLAVSSKSLFVTEINTWPHLVNRNHSDPHFDVGTERKDSQFVKRCQAL
jgi:hypothetical protein